MASVFLWNETYNKFLSQKFMVEIVIYFPKEGPIFLKLMAQMDELFIKYQENGKISFVYAGLVYWS